MVIKKAVADYRAKLFGMAALLVAFLIGFAPSLGITSLTISDSDPNTYIAVVMLMLPLFLIFSLKEELHFSFEIRRVMYGIAVFVVFIAALSYIRVASSYLFGLYRIDALMSALFLAALILVIFGVDGLRKLKFTVVYALFTSPLLLTPVIALNDSFTAGSAAGVYWLLQLFGLHVSGNGILSAGTLSVPITIASTCADLGLFIALVMLLVPIAYPFSGKIQRKALWIASAVALMLILNIARMFYIAYTWITSGPSAGLNVFHAFAGELLFYATLVIVILSATKYGLTIAKLKRANKRATKNAAYDRTLLIPIGIALLMGLVVLFLSLPYGVSLNLAPLAPVNATSSASVSIEYLQIANSLAYARMNIAQLGQAQLNITTDQGAESYLFSLSNSTYTGNNSVFAIVTPDSFPAPGFVLPSGGKTIKSGAVLLNNGISLHESLVSNGTYLDVAYFSIPYAVTKPGTGANPSNDYINYQFIATASNREGNGVPYCSFNVSPANYFESAVYNFLSGGTQLQGMPSAMCPGYRVASQLG